MKNRHFWIMFICCLVPIAGLTVALSLGVPLGTPGTVALLVLCPIVHILLMGRVLVKRVMCLKRTAPVKSDESFAEKSEVPANESR